MHSTCLTSSFAVQGKDTKMKPYSLEGMKGKIWWANFILIYLTYPYAQLCPDPLIEERRVREYSGSEFSSIYSYFFLFFFSSYCSGPQGIKHHLTFFSGMSKGVSSNRVLANSLPLQLSNVILSDLSLLFFCLKSELFLEAKIRLTDIKLLKYGYIPYYHKKYFLV